MKPVEKSKENLREEESLIYYHLTALKFPNIIKNIYDNVKMYESTISQVILIFLNRKYTEMFKSGILPVFHTTKLILEKKIILLNKA